MEMNRDMVTALGIYTTNRRLKSSIEMIETAMEQNHKLLISTLFPTIMRIYELWTPQIGESAVNVSFEAGIAFEVVISEVNGYTVRAQEKGKSVYHRFELNPSLEEYEQAVFVVPRSFYDSIAGIFAFTFWK